MTKVFSYLQFMKSCQSHIYFSQQKILPVKKGGFYHSSISSSRGMADSAPGLVAQSAPSLLPKEI